MFNKLYGHYKDNFDIEMRFTKGNVTYEEAWQQQQTDEAWF